jgi:hypothetical protein
MLSPSFRVAPGLRPLLALLAVASIDLFAVDAVEAQVADRPRVQVVQTPTPPVIDGRLDEAVWQTAPVATGFIQSAPSDGSPVSETTEVRLLQDDNALYVGAWLYDRNPGGIIVGESRRDASLGETDAFLFILDTFLDGQNGFVFGTTPAGIEHDGQVTREGQGGGGGERMQRGSGGGYNLNWDGSWTVATSRDERGWYAEFRIPFSTLRYDRDGLQSWGVNFARRIRRNNEEAFWSPIPRQFDLYRVSMAGRLEGIDAPFRRSLAVTPYVLTSGSKDYRGTADTDLTAEIGGDAKVALSPNLTLDLTVNTDFAQVEVDDQQINLTRFNLFFPEKRPFFLENAGTFSVGSNQAVELFFSRRIGIEGGREAPIVGGGRLTGRVAGNVVGLMSVQTGELEVEDAGTGNPIRLAAPNNFSVARLVRELPSRSRVGTILVSRLNTDDTDDYNLTYGLDWRWGVRPELLVDGYAARTVTPGVTGGQYAVNTSANFNSRDWSSTLAYREVAEGFNPEVGFLPRSDYRFVTATIMRRFQFPDIPWFYELRPHANYREHFALDGFSETRWIHIDSHFQFTNGAFFQLPAINLTREGLREPFEISRGVVVPPGTYDNLEWGFAYNSNLSSPLRIEGRIDIGGFYDGFRKGGSATVSGRVTDAFQASLRAQYYDVDLDGGSFETAVVGVRAAYSFTPRVYVQSLVQYNDQTRNVSGNIRFGWLNTAGTGLFIVYNDLEHLGPFSRTGITRGPTERALVIKFTRQFMLGG